MDRLKFTKIKKDIKSFIKYSAVSLFTLTSILLVLFSVICYFCAISNFSNMFNLQNATNGQTKTLSILLIALIFTFVAIIMVIAVYYLIKIILWQLGNIEKDEVVFYYFGKKWIVAVFSIILGFLSLFGFQFLFSYYIEWFNNVFTILLAISYFICGLVNLAFYIYTAVWYKRQPREYQEKYLAIVNQMNTNKQIKKEINKESKLSRQLTKKDNNKQVK